MKVKHHKSCFAFLLRDGADFEERQILRVSDHPVSALCILPAASSEQLELIAVASSRDHVIRVYRIDDAKPLYQLEGHTDTGRPTEVVLFFFILLEYGLQ